MFKIWRMERASDGKGPFSGKYQEILTPDEWEDFLADNVGKSEAIWQTRNGIIAPMYAMVLANKMNAKFGRYPLFGAPDEDCFNRWFPLKWRLVYASRGYVPVLYIVKDEEKVVQPSTAEVLFIPEDKKIPLDPKTLEPVT